jgi:hypothetical protein
MRGGGPEGGGPEGGGPEGGGPEIARLSGWPEVMRWTGPGGIVFPVVAKSGWRLVSASAGSLQEFENVDLQATSGASVPPLEISPGPLSVDVSEDGSRIAISARTLAVYNVSVLRLP